MNPRLSMKDAAELALSYQPIAEQCSRCSMASMLLWTITRQLAMKAVGEFLLFYPPMSRRRAARQGSWASRLRVARRSSWASRRRAARQGSWASRLRVARRSSWTSRRRAARPRLYKYVRCVYLGASCSSHFIARLSNLRIVKLLSSLHFISCSLLITLWRTSL